MEAGSSRPVQSRSCTFVGSVEGSNGINWKVVAAASLATLTALRI